MKLQRNTQGIIINVQVKPNSRQFQIKIDDDGFVVYCRETPVKGKVNRELMKKLSKFFNKKVEIISGLASRNKKILIKDADEAYIHLMLSHM